ncbi:MAG: hypothetical protein ACR2O8_14795 [Rhizobiaceae bacterium]
MRVLETLENLKVCIVDIEVELNGELRHAPTLCAVSEDKVIPLNTPDGRPVLMNPDNAILRDTQ